MNEIAEFAYSKWISFLTHHEGNRVHEIRFSCDRRVNFDMPIDLRSYLPLPFGPMTAENCFSGPILMFPRYDLKLSISMNCKNEFTFAAMFQWLW